MVDVDLDSWYRVQIDQLHVTVVLLIDAAQSQIREFIKKLPKFMGCASSSWYKIVEPRLAFSFSKLLHNFWERKHKCLLSLRYIFALCAIIRKLDFAQNCAITFLRYSILRNFAEQQGNKVTNRAYVSITWQWLWLTC